jgi:hypothetical protein
MFALGDLKGAKYKKLFDDLLSAIKNKPNIPDQSLMEIIKKAGIDEKIMETAGWFMRYSERIGRRKAWLTAYIKAKEAFGVGEGTNLEFDDPIIIQMANKTVENTQFLYNSASRPAFTATSMGKVYSRFQIFGYNSLKWRKNLTKLAMEQGFKPYTESYKKLQRLVTADMFMLTMASLLPMTIFDSVLAPPMNYVTNFNQFLFGNDDEKKKAFFGVLPYPANLLQPILPPSSRYISSLIALGMGNWDLLGMQVSGMYPFGRLGKQVGTSIGDPSQLPQQITGIPLMKLGQMFKQSAKRRDMDDELGIEANNH